jgi:hypothetical protein
MFYFLQKIGLKGKEGVFVFVKEDDFMLHFEVENNGKSVSFEKADFDKENVILIWETVRLFGTRNIKRLARKF